MSELKMISPLLDGMSVERETPGHNGRTCYTLRSSATGEHFILKQISIPASDNQVRALILSGAYPDEASVHQYYSRVVKDIRTELEIGNQLSSSGCFAGAISYQIEPKESGVGFDIYILYPLYIPLNTFLAQNAMTSLRALNLGIDLCDALASCREAGYLFENVKPENIFFMSSDKFLLGDLGLASLRDLQYSCVPEDYLGPYAAPELSDITAAPNLTIDLYSLGMVLYRIYNGNHGPFEDENTSEAVAEKLRMTGKPLPTPLYADYELAAIILKACAFRQEDRYQSPEELKQALVLYMQRNQVSDTLIVPPIVAEEAPVAPADSEPVEEAPMRMTDAEKLDEDFRRSFAPDLSGSGTEADVDTTIELEQIPLKQEEASPVEPSQPTEASAPTEEESDPDQLDLDSFIASINQYVEENESSPAAPAEQTPEPVEEQSAPTHVDATPETAESEAVPQEDKKHGHKVLAAFLIAFFLLAIVACAYFLVDWYYVGVDKLSLVSATTDQMVVELTSRDSLENFVLTCTDSYGNAYPVSADGNRYTISGLTEKTTYTVTVSAAGRHRLSSASAYTLTHTTPETTEITQMTAVRGEADGEVQLSFVYEGPTPEGWKLTCTADGAEDKTYEFEGSSCLIQGLERSRVYTFTLGSTDDVCLTGETSIQYELLPIVEVKNLRITKIEGQQVTIAWECGENVPSSWDVTCEAVGATPISGTAAEPSFTLELPDFTHEYTISVAARGMDLPETLILPANPIIIENLNASVNEDGTVSVHWDTPAGAPESGWYLSYNTVGSLHAAYMPDAEHSVIEGSTATLRGLIPDADYEITLSLTSGDSTASIFGTTTTTVHTPAAAAFTAYGINPAAPLSSTSGYISLWREPDKENWNYTDLGYNTNTFSPDQSIAVCIQVNSFTPSEDEVELLYVIRDAEGHVVNDVSSTLPWNNIWYNYRHASVIPMPARAGEAATAGEYRLEIYVNSQLLASANFTIA